MKRRITFLIALFLGAGLAFAQNTGGDKSSLNPQPLPPGRHPQTEQKTETKKSHKGGKKGKKGTASTAPKQTTQPSTPPK